GYFLHEYGIHPGSYSLGAIMSGKGPQWKHTMKEQNSNAFGQDKTPPGQAKKEQTGQEWTPPGQAKKDEGDHNWTPPGQEKKDKGNNGH
ncbi:MAG: hypothetical protein SVX38_13405, partial [Chloroflexota bacterium]|nr:hypothetical protein [Chloroflexota bacterium]